MINLRQKFDCLSQMVFTPTLNDQSDLVSIFKFSKFFLHNFSSVLCKMDENHNDDALLLSDDILTRCSS